MELMQFFKETGSEGGKKAAKTMSKAARIERARKAAAARWGKARPQNPAASSAKVSAKKAAKRKR